VSKMFDYISGQAGGRVAELEASLEHLMANCVPASAIDELQAENAELRALLADVLASVEWSSPSQIMKLRIERALKE